MDLAGVMVVVVVLVVIGFIGIVLVTAAGGGKGGPGSSTGRTTPSSRSANQQTNRPPRQSSTASPDSVVAQARTTNVKFAYTGEFNGRTEWGEVEASSRDDALAKLQANGIKVRVLQEKAASASGGREVLGALLGDDALEFDEDYQRAVRVMDNWERIHKMDPDDLRNDPKAQRLIRGLSQLPYPDIVLRAKRLLNEA